MLRNLNPSAISQSAIRSGGEFGQTFVFAFSGEIILKVLRSAPSPRTSQYRDQSNRSSHLETGEAVPRDDSSEQGSRSLSRAPSVSAAMSASLNRKASRTSLMSRRSSLPSLKRGHNLARVDPKAAMSLQVAVSGGTLDRLIDVLIDGLEVVVSSTDDFGLSAGAARSLSLDQDDFRTTWWATFRSYVSAFVFFEVCQQSYSSLPFAHYYLAFKKTVPDSSARFDRIRHRRRRKYIPTSDENLECNARLACLRRRDPRHFG